MVGGHGDDQYELPEASGRLFVPGNRQARAQFRGGPSGRAHHSPGHRRRGAAAAGAHHQCHEGWRGRDGAQGNLPRLRRPRPWPRKETFRGYDDRGRGYDFLLEPIAAHFRSQGVEVAPDAIFVSDGSKRDRANIREIFAIDNIVAVPDPVYPLYVATNVMAGGTGPADPSGRYGKLVYLPTTAENGFEPALPSGHVDLIYLCSPNNPTGAVMSRASLQRWGE